MTPEFFIEFALTPALRLLPPNMSTTPARAMVIAICLQESQMENRKQLGGGPARGYAQFEQGGGVRGVLSHPASKPHIQAVLSALDYDPLSDPAKCYAAIEHNDILAAAFARLLLWTLPDPLPARGEMGEGWSQYIAAWRPGKPHRASWDKFFNDAWGLVVRE